VQHQRHDALIRQQFRSQAATFTDKGFAARGLDWLTEFLAPREQIQVLEVAAGAGHLGRAIASKVAHVSAIDITPEMLEQGHRLATDSEITNIAFLVGNAMDLPWIHEQFDLTVTRLSLHQVVNPAGMIKEMARVTRRGGQVAVIDMVTEDDPRVAIEVNRLERLRDPSHGRTLSRSEIADLVSDAGLHIDKTEERDQPLDFEDWLERTSTPPEDREAIRRCVEEDLNGGTPTGLRPERDASSAITLTHPWLAVLATRR
jgi:SAM-dependent methyltransferase